MPVAPGSADETSRRYGARSQPGRKRITAACRLSPREMVCAVRHSPVTSPLGPSSESWGTKSSDTTRITTGFSLSATMPNGRS